MWPTTPRGVGHTRMMTLGFSAARGPLSDTTQEKITPHTSAGVCGVIFLTLHSLFNRVLRQNASSSSILARIVATVGMTAGRSWRL